MPMSRSRRVRRYRNQTGAATLTPAQQRRTRKKARHARAAGLANLAK